ncbi:MAG: selenocysteine-specific translation elongation factor [Actinomycetota bacterium]|nr:selenocysteine-specific translation elongation factor [Actinomycetota bacterium]
MTAERAARPGESPEPAPDEPQVVATAGHVDHGKSALILRLTGIDPDRLAEEKRRGLTIDLGFAWATLPSGREVGFVDVPGHERFVRNMLAGVGPVRLVLFVVAADEGWKPQSEEHLAIVDVLGVHGGVVALTKRDLVDEETLDIAVEEVRERLAGTALEGAPIVPVSSFTGEGLDDLRAALDDLVAAAPPPEQAGRPRQFVDRVFSIRGAGTVVTGTLAGGPLRVGQEIEVYPVGARARIRGLQTHKLAIDSARPVSRVATNLVGVEREQLERGDVIGLPGQWRPTTVFEARITPIRGLDHALSARGAYKLYAGSAERDARIRFYPGEGGAFARIRLSAPVVLDVHERFVLREAGRRATVAGGTVLDTEPPMRPGPQPERRLGARERATREELPPLLVRERGAIRASDLVVLVGLSPQHIPGARRAGAWWVSEDLYEGVTGAVTGAIGRFHAEHPLREGTDLSLARSAAAEPFERAGRGADPGLVEALVEDLVEAGKLHRSGSEVRLSSHRVALDERREEVDRLVEAVAAGGTAPPSVPELVRSGFSREVVDAAGRAGAIVRVSPDIVLTPELVRRAEEVLRRTGATGVTVSAFREELGTSRKYALPLLEWFDQRGVTRRQGDLRFLRRPD